MKNGTCPKCGSQAVMADVEVRDVGGTGPYTLRVAIQEPEPPKHGLLWTPEDITGEVHAWICTKCGYTELYTNNLEDLYQMYKKSHP